MARYEITPMEKKHVDYYLRAGQTGKARVAAHANHELIRTGWIRPGGSTVIVTIPGRCPSFRCTITPPSDY